MKKCKAICERNKKRCKMSATFGNYCLKHYLVLTKKPKKKARKAKRFKDGGFELIFK